MRKRFALSAILAAAVVMPAVAAPSAEPVTWTHGDKTFSGFLVYDKSSDTRRPGLVMVPNWLGVTELAVERAKEIAGDDYVVLVADVYGQGVRPRDKTEARAQVMKVYSDGGTTLRARTRAALDALEAQAGKAPLDPVRLGALGFCFGGSAALELARSGAELAGVVSIHGGLQTYLPTEGNRVAAPVLVLNGAADTSVPVEHIAGFQQEMDAAGADWQLVNFSGARHCFTQEEDASDDPNENCRYDARTARRAFRMMDDFFDEVFAAE